MKKAISFRCQLRCRKPKGMPPTPPRSSRPQELSLTITITFSMAAKSASRPIQHFHLRKAYDPVALSLLTVVRA